LTLIIEYGKVLFCQFHFFFSIDILLQRHLANEDLCMICTCIIVVSAYKILMARIKYPNLDYTFAY